ncbi:MAG: hypothetical protein KF690_00400 [Bacteroidetes bacterium]|nr:hypothetical protein [Bacteroidota bacterium]
MPALAQPTLTSQELTGTYRLDTGADTTGGPLVPMVLTLWQAEALGPNDLVANLSLKAEGEPEWQSSGDIRVSYDPLLQQLDLRMGDRYYRFYQATRQADGNLTLRRLSNRSSPHPHFVKVGPEE